MSSYRSAIDWLNENNPFMVTPIMNLGKPKFNTGIPTAQVEPDSDGDIFLSINPDFFSQHSDSECAGVLTHELYHIIFNHLAEFDRFENHQARTIAQECIVNDSVLEEGMSLPDINLYYGEDWVKYNTSFLPTKIVYDDLMKDPENLPQEVEIACSHDASKSLDHREAFNKAFKDVSLDDASESMKDVLEEAASKAGSDFSFQQTTQSGRKISLKWVSLINKIHPKTFTEGGKSQSKSTWARPRRKLAGMPERIMLPDRESKNEAGFGGSKRPKILLALDTSGSIPKEKVTELMDLASTIPDKKVNVSCCTFSTYPVKFDHKLTPDLQKIASGGTDFSAIVEYQKDNNLLDAPVIVITDGYACFYGNDHPSNMNSNWHWLVFDGRGIGDRRVTKNIENYTDFVA